MLIVSYKSHPQFFILGEGLGQGDLTCWIMNPTEQKLDPNFCHPPTHSENRKKCWLRIISLKTTPLFPFFPSFSILFVPAGETFWPKKSCHPTYLIRMALLKLHFYHAQSFFSWNKICLNIYVSYLSSLKALVPMQSDHIWGCNLPQGWTHRKKITTPALSIYIISTALLNHGILKDNKISTED